MNTATTFRCTSGRTTRRPSDRATDTTVAVAVLADHIAPRAGHSRPAAGHVATAGTRSPKKPSEYLEYAERHGDDGHGPTYWCDVEDLLVEEWTATTILVTAEVPAGQAPLFTDGASAFPELALREAGLSAFDVDDLRDGRPAARAIDRTWGKPRHEVDTAERLHALPVTWVDTVAGLFGPHAVAAFQALLTAPGRHRRVTVHRG